MKNIKVGQTWKSKYLWPEPIGYHYIVIRKMNGNNLYCEFQTVEGEWREDDTVQNIDWLLSHYDLVSS